MAGRIAIAGRVLVDEPFALFSKKVCTNGDLAACERLVMGSTPGVDGGSMEDE